MPMKLVNGLPEDLDPTEFADEIVPVMLGLVGESTQRRRASREQLIEMGPVVLPQLFRMLDSRHQQLRWEAAQVIKMMGAKEAIPILLLLLTDREDDIRWIAAEGLIEIGRPALVPLLGKVVEHAADPDIRQGAHHVLVRLLTIRERQVHKKLLHALDHYQKTGEMVPFWAGQLLDELLLKLPME
jgi:HEAT repeat protein